MNDQVHTITDAQPAGQPPIPPPPPKSETYELEQEADNAIKYLQRFAMTDGLDPDLRLAFGEIVGTIKTLKQTVKTQAKTAEQNYHRVVEMTRAQRLIGN